MTRILARLNSNWTVALLVLMALLTYAFEHVRWRGAPIVIHEVEVEWIEGFTGPYLLVRMDVEKKRECPGTIYRMIVDARGVVQQVIQPGEPFLRRGDTVASLRFPMPKLEPGQYTYKSLHTYICPDGAWRVEAPPATFTVPDGPAPPTLE